MKKGTLIAIVIAGISIIGGFIYFVGGVSSTYPPIRKYEYKGGLDQFITSIHDYASTTPTVQYEITDTVGSKDNGYATYIHIEVRNTPSDIEFELKCEEDKHSGIQTKTAISLVGAYDKTKNIGSYSKDAKDADILAKQFELTVLKRLKDSQNIK